jgi:RNase H
VSPSKEDAKALHNEIQELTDPTTAVIYTDGSGIEGKIGAAIYSPTMDKIIHQHLGTEAQYNIFIAKVTALKLAAETMQEDHTYTDCHIYKDSQAAIKAIENPRHQPGQAVIQDFLNCIDDIADKHPGLQFHK